MLNNIIGCHSRSSRLHSADEVVVGAIELKANCGQVESRISPEIYLLQWRLQQLIGRDVVPRFLDCPWVSWRAGCHLDRSLRRIRILDGYGNLQTASSHQARLPSTEQSMLTGLKCVALSTLRTGCINASRTTTAKSDPEYPSVFWARAR